MTYIYFTTANLYKSCSTCTPFRDTPQISLENHCMYVGMEVRINRVKLSYRIPTKCIREKYGITG